MVVGVDLGLVALAPAARAIVRALAHRTGVPALVVAAVLVAVGYRILKRSARFAFEVALVVAAMLVLTEMGWIRW